MPNLLSTGRKERPAAGARVPAPPGGADAEGRRAEGTRRPSGVLLGGTTAGRCRRSSRPCGRCAPSPGWMDAGRGWRSAGSTLNEPLGALRRAGAGEDLDAVVGDAHGPGLPDAVRVDLELDLDAAVVRLGLELPVGGGGAAPAALHAAAALGGGRSGGDAADEHRSRGAGDAEAGGQSVVHGGVLLRVGVRRGDGAHCFGLWSHPVVDTGITTDESGRYGVVGIDMTIDLGLRRGPPRCSRGRRARRGAVDARRRALPTAWAICWTTSAVLRLRSPPPRPRSRSRSLAHNRVPPAMPAASGLTGARGSLGSAATGRSVALRPGLGRDDQGRRARPARRGGRARSRSTNWVLDGSGRRPVVRPALPDRRSTIQPGT